VTISPKQELACWLAGSLLAIALFLRSHTFYVTAETYCYGAAFLSVLVFLLWVRFRRRSIPSPKWLRVTANTALVILGAVFLLYILGVATYYE